MPDESDTTGTDSTTTNLETRDSTSPDSQDVVLRPLTGNDGAALWTLTRDSQVLDLNSSYYYLLWSRDFGSTSLLAERDGAPIGFVTGYLRPDEPQTLMIWQVAVSEAARGLGLASLMLDELVERTGADALETTITDDNEGSKALFASLARRRGADHVVTALFTPEMYPDGHDTEFLHRIEPLFGSDDAHHDAGAS